MASSTLGSVTLSLCKLLKAAMPAKVEVTSLPLTEAGTFVKRSGLLARVNLVCQQVSPSPGTRNISLARFDSSALNGPKPSPLTALYLLTIYGTSLPEQEQSTEGLVEAVCRAIEQKPLLTATDLTAALSGATGIPATATARVVPQALSAGELASIFLAAETPYRPTLAYQVTVAEE
jgi:hypothetical protein